MNINDFDLDYKKKIALAHLAGGKTLKIAAEKSDLTTSTISKLKNSSQGKKLLKLAVAEVYDGILAQITLECLDVVLELSRIVNDPESSRREKIAAGNVLLEHAKRAKDAVMETRLDELEEELDDFENESESN